MTTIPVEQIQAQAREVAVPDFGRLLATIFASLFFALGWLAGRAWYVSVLAVLAVRVGFRDGAKLPPKQPKSPPGQ